MSARIPRFAFLAAMLAAAVALTGCQRARNALTEFPSYLDSSGETVVGYEMNAPEVGFSTFMGDDAGEPAQFSRQAAVLLAANGTPAQPATPVALSQRLMIFKVNIAVRVQDFAAGVKAAQQIASQVGGFVEGSNISDHPETPSSATVTLRVPADKLEEATQLARDLGKVLDESRSAEDVTSEMVDIDARLKNLRASETSLRAMMAASRKMTETLQIEQRLTQVRSEIESIEARRRTLSDQVALSTLTIQVLEPRAIYKGADQPWSVAAAFHEGWDRTRMAGRALAVLGINLLTATPLWAPLFVLIVLAVRQRRRRVATAE